MYFSAMSKFFYHNKIKIVLRKFIISPLTINQIKLSSSNETDNIIQEGEWIFEKSPTVGLPQVSKLIDLEISKRLKETILLRKKHSIKGKTDLLWKPRSITLLDGSCYEAVGWLISQNVFSYPKCFACNAENTLQLKITKKWI